MDKQTGFFEESPGNFSIMRVAFAWLVLNGTVMGWYSLMTLGVGEAAAIFGTIITSAMALKIVQKNQEK